MVATYDLFIISSMNISGDSMEPTLHGRNPVDRVMFRESFYTLERGDIIIFYRSENEELYPIADCPGNKNLSIGDFFAKCGDVTSDLLNVFIRVFNKNGGLPHHFSRSREGYKILIKRVIGVGGDVIRIQDAKLYIQYGGEGEFVLQNEDYINGAMQKRETGYGVKDGEWVVAEDEFFVLGDNRNNSIDSEDFGPIKDYQILGNVFVIQRDGSAIRLE